MRIAKQDQAYTAIATSDAERITIRGHDLCDDLIGQIDFTDYFWLRFPYSFDGEPELSVSPPPLLDEHGAHIREELKRRKAG